MTAPLESIAGCLLGTAVGDALGLPYENLSPRRAARLLGPPDRLRFFLGRGMISDDTEHTVLVAQSFHASTDEASFLRQLARRLGWWLMSAPCGFGLATLRAVVKLWLGWSPTFSGVFSAGNGPAMRVSILGVLLPDRERLRSYVRASTRLTHTDPKAEHGAYAVALAAHLICRPEDLTPEHYLAEVSRDLADAPGFLQRLSDVVASVTTGETTPAFATRQGWQRGVSGYVYHSVPVALHAWLSHPNDFRTAVMNVIQCGGDTDTMAAITGSLVGIRIGRSGIPADWLAQLRDGPLNVAYLDRLAEALANQSALPPLPFVPTLLRNLGFFIIVVSHVLRRLLPPY